MSDNDSNNDESSTKTEKKAVVFSEKEEMILKVAWRCLKSGPPEVRRQKFMFCARSADKTRLTWKSS